MKWYVYIITNHTNRVLYTGITNDLNRRIFEHKSGIICTSFSTKYKLYKLIWFEEFTSPRDAISSEKKIKGWTREKKLKLIRQLNPNFKDLYSQ